MPFRESPWPRGAPCWAELLVTEFAPAERFYRGLFGWELRSHGPGQWRWLLGGREVGGIGEVPEESDLAGSWSSCLCAPDLGETVKMVNRHGGKTLTENGEYALLADPAGAVFGLRRTGAEVSGEPGSVSWSECLTPSAELSRAFYETVFGYHCTDLSVPGFTYHGLCLDGRIVGGLGELPPDVPGEVPAHWTTYFAVADADVSTAKVAELGGRVLSPPSDSPNGRLAAVTDSQGVSFGLIAAGRGTRRRSLLSRRPRPSRRSS